MDGNGNFKGLLLFGNELIYWDFEKTESYQQLNSIFPIPQITAPLKKLNSRPKCESRITENTLEPEEF